MPRLRIPGLPLHIVHRGNSRDACFFHERDYARYLEKLAENAVLFDCRVHAYVLMGNHVHLLVSPGTADAISWFMKRLAQDHAQFVNRTYKRTGALWENRYYAGVVDSDRYFLTCHRYIESNPVRAAMVAHPGEYAWSSFRTNALGEASRLVQAHELYTALGRSGAERQAAYQALFAEPLHEHEMEAIRAATRGGRAVGAVALSQQLKAEAAAVVSRGGTQVCPR